MEEDMIINGDEVLVPPIAETIPLTPDVPVDIEVPPVAEAPVTASSCDDAIGNFFGTIQESVTIAWRFHLKTKKHRVHVTLNEYYEGALDLVDTIIEQYQGATSTTVENYTNTILDTDKDEVAYFQELKAFVEKSKGEHAFDDATISAIDDLVALIDSTLYKLTSFTESAIKSFDEFCFEDYDVIGVEGGVDGVFDTVTKTTKTNLAPSGATTGGCCSSKPKCKCKDKDCDCEDSDSKCKCDDEEEEE